MTTEQTPLQALIASLGLRMDAVFIPRSRTPNATETVLHKMQIHWSVKITREGRNAELTAPYSEGIGHLPKPLRPKDLRHVTMHDAECTKDALELGTYSMNPGLLRPRKPIPPPAIADVLFCLVSDASALDAPDFEHWAAEYGYDADSREAERTYQTCISIGLALRRMLSDVELAALREAFQDY